MTRSGGTAVRRLVAVTALVPAVLVWTALLTWAASPASAHAWLVSATPADGAAALAPPDQVRLQFSEPVVIPAGRLAVQYADGRVAARAGTAVQGSVITLALPHDLAAGVYVLRYRATCRTGHVLDGVTTFAVTGPPGAGGPAGARGSAASGPGVVTPDGVGTRGSVAAQPFRPDLWFTGIRQPATAAVVVLLGALVLQYLRRRLGTAPALIAVTAAGLSAWVLLPALGGEPATAASASSVTAGGGVRRLTTSGGRVVLATVTADRDGVGADLNLPPGADGDAPIAVAELRAPGTVLPPVRLPLQQVGPGTLHAEPVRLPATGDWRLTFTLTHADGAVEQVTTPVQVS